jgi:hypothetical protein
VFLFDKAARSANTTEKTAMTVNAIYGIMDVFPCVSMKGVFKDENPAGK